MHYHTCVPAIENRHTGIKQANEQKGREYFFHRAVFNFAARTIKGMPNIRSNAI
jgi:hypothetical protein